MKNYIDEKGNYINIENLSLKQIYDRGFEAGKKSKEEKGKPMRLCDDCIHKSKCEDYQDKVVKTNDMDFFGCSAHENILPIGTTFHVNPEDIKWEVRGDLISREALKNEIDKLFKSGGYDSGLVLDTIDNAPTVETLKDITEVHCDITEEQLLNALRPQGEWIFLKANEEQTDGYECSVCKATFHTRVPYFSEFNFCPNCGADMQKGGAE